MHSHKNFAVNVADSDIQQTSV